VFEEYLELTLKKVWERYPGKTICVVMDNFSAHMTDDVTKLLAHSKVQGLYLPTQTPTYSSIESCFGTLKRKLQKEQITSKSRAAFLLQREMFSMSVESIQGFFARVLLEMK